MNPSKRLNIMEAMTMPVDWTMRRLWLGGVNDGDCETEGCDPCGNCRAEALTDSSSRSSQFGATDRFKGVASVSETTVQRRGLDASGRNLGDRRRRVETHGLNNVVGCSRDSLYREGALRWPNSSTRCKFPSGHSLAHRLAAEPAC